MKEDRGKRQIRRIELLGNGISWESWWAGERVGQEERKWVPITTTEIALNELVNRIASIDAITGKVNSKLFRHWNCCHR